MDQCTHCQAVGNMDRCLNVPCSIRESWFGIEMTAQREDALKNLARLEEGYDQLKESFSRVCVRRDALLAACKAALERFPDESSLPTSTQTRTGEILRQIKVAIALAEQK